MKKKIAECLVDHSNGGCDIYEGYSGRGMFGDTTYGVTCDRFSSFFFACINASLEEPHIMDESLDEEFNYDSLGLGLIIY